MRRALFPDAMTQRFRLNLRKSLHDNEEHLKQCERGALSRPDARRGGHCIGPDGPEKRSYETFSKGHFAVGGTLYDSCDGAPSAGTNAACKSRDVTGGASPTTDAYQATDANQATVAG